MKARYLDDPQRGPGHGLLRVAEPGALALQDSLTFSIRRASDQQCIGAAGRQSAEVFLSPEGVNLENGDLCLGIGPAVVDLLDPLETYRLTLLGADGQRAACPLEVALVTYSPAGGGAGVGMTPAPKTAPTPPPPPPPAPEPDPEPAPLPDLEIAPVEPAKRGKNPLLFILPVLLLLAAGGFAYWKFVLDKPADPVPAAQNATAPALEAPLAQARKYLSGPADPAAGVELAKKLRADKDSADAVFLLMEDAAGKGNAEAMLAAGEFYDPTATIDIGTIEKDPLQALDWYTKAKAAGNAGAEAKLAGLKAWAEAEAPKGTAGAKDVLEKINK